MRPNSTKGRQLSKPAIALPPTTLLASTITATAAKAGIAIAAGMTSNSAVVVTPR